MEADCQFPAVLITAHIHLKTKSIGVHKFSENVVKDIRCGLHRAVFRLLDSVYYKLCSYPTGTMNPEAMRASDRIVGNTVKLPGTHITLRSRVN